MANNKQRYINTKFWNDNYIAELDPIEKLLFIYFLTNEHTNISGFYEIPLKIVGIETGIDTSMLDKILPRLEDKIRYVKGFVIIKNFIKHQETGSELVQKGIINCLKDLDRKFIEDVVSKGFYELPKYYLDTLSIQYVKSLNYSDLDSNSNSFKNAPLKSDIEELLEDKGGIKYDYQFVGLQVFEKTGAPASKKAECIRLAKKYPNLINPSLSFCLDYPNPAVKWKMFLWKLNKLSKENA